MSKNIISHARHAQIAAAFRAGRAAAREVEVSTQLANPFAERDGSMPSSFASARCAQWHAFEAGVEREKGRVSGAGTMLRNARFCMLRATELGRV